mmetsp:Transcript_23301/g.72922  ORF Transcript_23301/g.72922 Transcript_23301/m.72922 type:complete len:288 (+) Transcript_23301:810-1673(+)
MAGSSVGRWSRPTPLKARKSSQMRIRRSLNRTPLRACCRTGSTRSLRCGRCRARRPWCSYATRGALRATGRAIGARAPPCGRTTPTSRRRSRAVIRRRGRRTARTTASSGCPSSTSARTLRRSSSAASSTTTPTTSTASRAIGPARRRRGRRGGRCARRRACSTSTPSTPRGRRTRKRVLEAFRRRRLTGPQRPQPTARRRPTPSRSLGTLRAARCSARTESLSGLTTPSFVWSRAAAPAASTSPCSSGRAAARAPPSAWDPASASTCSRSTARRRACWAVSGSSRT